MTNLRRKSASSKRVKEEIIEPNEQKIEEEEKIESTSSEINNQPIKKVYLNEEDKRFLKKLNKHIVNKLGLHSNRSVKI